MNSLETTVSFAKSYKHLDVHAITNTLTTIYSAKFKAHSVGLCTSYSWNNPQLNMAVGKKSKPTVSALLDVKKKSLFLQGDVSPFQLTLYADAIRKSLADTRNYDSGFLTLKE